MKVYCKHCKFDRGISATYCYANDEFQTDDYYSPRHKTDDEIWEQREVNENNNCPHYQRKWWKFWRKE